MKRDFHYNSPKMKLRRKELRNKLTPQEKKFWTMIRNSKIGYKFIRQYSVDNYVLDFFCPEKRIGIEIDGSSHVDKIDYDLFRHRYISAFDIRVLIYSNYQIDSKLNKVVKNLRKICNQTSPS